MSKIQRNRRRFPTNGGTLLNQGFSGEVATVPAGIFFGMTAEIENFLRHRTDDLGVQAEVIKQRSCARLLRTQDKEVRQGPRARVKFTQIQVSLFGKRWNTPVQGESKLMEGRDEG